MKRWRGVIFGIISILGGLIALPAPGVGAAGYTVDTTSDSNLTACTATPGDCSLRGAINNANSSGAADTITFDASLFNPGTIAIASALPPLTAGGDSIDATGAFVTIQGAEARTFSCLSVSSASNTVKGLSITDCDNAIQLNDVNSDNNTLGPGITLFDNVNGIYIGSASATGNTISGNKLGTNSAGTAIPPEGANSANNIAIFGSNNTVGGVITADRNIISGAGVGVWLPGTNNQVYGNYIGTDVNGTLDLGNVDSGIEISSGGASNTIGGLSPGQGNLVSGNDVSNVYITASFGGGGANNVVQGNIIGPTINGTAALTNTDGVDVTNGASGNIIGPGNVISDNIDGVWMAGVGTSGNVVKGNFIGTNLAGTAALANSSNGVEVAFSASSNVIGGVNPGDGNVIAFNLDNGVAVIGSSTLGNTIRGNSIHNNGLWGIALLSGGNGGLTPPTVNSVSPPSGIACLNCIVDVYSDDAGQGRVHQGSTIADGAGNWSFGGAVVGPYITATATNAAGNTSEFSLSVCLDSDADTTCNATDTDDDNDGFTDISEAGAPLCGNGTNDDGSDDAVADDGCPGGPDQAGALSEAQFKIGTNSLYPCGFNSWPADLYDQGALSANKITLQDLASYVAPVRRLNTNPGDANFSSRWDLVPGKGSFLNMINLQDMAAIVILAPPMLNGARALNGPVCPLPSQ